MTGETASSQPTRAGRLERVVALTGAASLVLAVAGDSTADVSGDGVDSAMSDQALVREVQAHAAELSAGAWIMTLGAVLGVVFLGSLWVQFARGSEWLAVIAVAGGLLFSIQVLRLAAGYLTLASTEELHDGPVARLVLSADYETGQQLPVPPLIMVVAALLASFRYGLFPRWFRWFNAALLVLLAIAFLPIGPAGLMGLLGTLWFPVASVLFARRPVPFPASDIPRGDISARTR